MNDSECIHCGSTWIEGSRCLDCGRAIDRPISARRQNRLLETSKPRTLPGIPAKGLQAADGATVGRETATGVGGDAA